MITLKIKEMDLVTSMRKLLIFLGEIRCTHERHLTYYVEGIQDLYRSQEAVLTVQRRS